LRHPRTGIKNRRIFYRTRANNSMVVRAQGGQAAAPAAHSRL